MLAKAWQREEQACELPAQATAAQANVTRIGRVYRPNSSPKSSRDARSTSSASARAAPPSAGFSHAAWLGTAFTTLKSSCARRTRSSPVGNAAPRQLVRSQSHTRLALAGAGSPPSLSELCAKEPLSDVAQLSAAVMGQVCANTRSVVLAWEGATAQSDYALMQQGIVVCLSSPAEVADIPSPPSPRQHTRSRARARMHPPIHTRAQPTRLTTRAATHARAECHGRLEPVRSRHVDRRAQTRRRVHHA